MRIFTGRPKNRMGYAYEDWVQVRADERGRHFEKRLPDCVIREVLRIWGVAIGGWFVGVQRVDVRDDR